MWNVMQLAERVNVSPSTVRSYARRGLLRPRPGAPNGPDLFGDEALRQLQIICEARALGFRFSEITALLARTGQAQHTRQEAQAILECHLRETYVRLVHLSARAAAVKRVLEMLRQENGQLADG